MRKSQTEQIKGAFGERVRTMRQEKGLSQENLALACELDRTYIGGVERGERNISLVNIYKGEGGTLPFFGPSFWSPTRPES